LICAVVSAFPELVRKAGVPMIRMHDLRHTCAKLLLEGDTSAKVVTKGWGHSGVKGTLDNLMLGEVAEWPIAPVC
jgi:integrase